jgi:hypothetical protein
MKSFRRKDSSDEKALQPFLDAVYVDMGLDFCREERKEQQLAGIDVIIRFRHKEYFIDEKAATHYVNKGLNTFAFELNFRHNGMTIPGWLFDENKLTTHYFLMSEIESSSAHVEDLTAFRLVSVNRRKLLQFLQKKQWGKEFLTEKVNRVMEDRARYVLSPSNPEARVVKTRHLQEKPLNLVIVLDDLIQAGVAKELIPGPKQLNEVNLNQLFKKAGLC